MTDTKSGDNERSEGNESVPTAGYGAESEGPGAQIGSYKLIGILGEGGYGIVYLADQYEPVRRRVALKVIKPGMDSRQVIARFEAERQALALLDHPNIAHVHEAGTTSAGRPYFAMEYVKGVSIVEHCDRHKLSVEERLELFLQVCEAVQHAHQKGIIHRDIKPSNILVSFENERAVPKVIDFGIAKAISQPLTDRTLYTERGQLVGTLEYMSPEQAEMTSQDIDTRSDIYSLGVVLYELLTGVLPFESDTLRQGDADHLKQIIREQDPKTPSTRLSRLTREDSSRIAQQRHVQASVLRRRLRGDLDWITLKAMEKDRTRRYSSAGELAADIRRHMNDEPVAAGPPSTLYRMRKCIHRHRALVTGLAAVLLVFLAGVAGVAVFAVKADRQARTAQAVADFLNNDLLGAVAPEQAKSPQVTVHSILDTASTRLEGKFAEQPLVEAEIRQTLGQTYIELSDYKLAEPHMKRAYDIRRKHLGDKDPLTLTSMSQLGRLYLLENRNREAEPLLAQAVELSHRVLGTEHRDTLESSVWLGQLYMDFTVLGRQEEAERLLRAVFESSSRVLGKQDPITLEAMYNLAFLYGCYWGRADEAVPLCLEGCQTAQSALGEGHRLTLRFMTLSAWFLAWEGRDEEAVARAKTAMETYQRMLGKDNADTLAAMATLGMIYACQFDFEKAESLLSESLPPLRGILGEGHGGAFYFTEWLGVVYMSQGRYREAEQLFMKLLEDERRLLGDDHVLVLGLRACIVFLYATQERADELQTWCSREMDRIRRSPGHTNLATAFVLNFWAMAQATYPSPAIRNGPEAVKHATEACELMDWKGGMWLDTLATAYAAVGDFASAVKWEKRAIEASEQERGWLDPSAAEYRLRLYESGRSFLTGSTSTWFTTDSHILLGQKEYERAERLWVKALAANRRYLGESHPETRGSILAIIQLYEDWGKPEEAEKWRAQLPVEIPVPNRWETIHE
jgi:serine/threonine protein kinase/tetratricopeptide (TPR) repeat protein